jgi:hypothetical protein
MGDKSAIWMSWIFQSFIGAKNHTLGFFLSLTCLYFLKFDITILLCLSNLNYRVKNSVYLLTRQEVYRSRHTGYLHFSIH